MGNINAVVDLQQDGEIAVITMDNPPVNALGHVLREGLAAAFARVAADAATRAVVLTGTTRAFSGGADITEFGKTPTEPNLRAVIATIEALPKPVVAAIRGVALGGGLELALGCHYRVAWTGARLGLPEVKLGLLPGAGGTQRLPRVIGIEKAMRLILTGNFVSAEEAAADGLVDRLMDGDGAAPAVAFAREVLAKGLPLRQVRARDEHLVAARADHSIIDRAAAPLLKRSRGAMAPRNCAAAVKAAVTMPFDEGLAEERRLFNELLVSDESRAQRHLFFAEREAAKVPDMPADVKPAKIRRAVILGAGTMGGGIAMNFANVGIPVTVIEAEQAALDRGLDRVAGNYRVAVQRGSLPAGAPEERMALITGTTDFGAVADCDIVIEAVFEDMALKKKIFTDLDRLAKPGTLLASNTSTLDINEMAAVTKRPEDVLGMHFFSPANVMKLLEIVRAAKTSHQSLATALAVGRTIGKVCAVVGVCDGFVGNRMLHQRGTETERLLLEGALPQDIDAVVTRFGFPMGPCAMGDLAGLDVGWRIRQHRGTKAPVADALCEAGRFGQKTRAGYYAYGEDGRTPSPDSEVERIIREASAAHQITRRAISAEEIEERMFYPMINEAARILAEGIAVRPGDIDIIWVNGYGWPTHRGGPMFYADLVGLPKIAERLNHYAQAVGDKRLAPAPLLERLAREGRGFLSLGVLEATK
ncbi:3-hydroxyacyl-CoA dehydrogenase NAD-binding domain-containing protein [Acidisphaera rubrifaciens]|uniref:3-hydroxyacyl-CoA dehydrogenase n=1 Tax=Acidisphaera rubrifaciens HS-AP3 TaxID=1231350 RepID=A0A0D6P5E3_9PROT|nr:3-hydroxyacyl-CoA dehydrogenase NAD-binding domain-containing protein [Acidisphaera rubrifaciens]GAN76413.1 3-hydroxyacyl-CoA dehydrogenase [Acidisphaera rubrifaciens HS-AP3]